MPVATPVPGSVKPKGGASVRSGTAGEAITEGDVVYLSASSVLIADSTTAAKAAVAGVAIADCAIGDVCYYVGTNDMVLITGATFTQFTWYVLGGTAGTIETYADLTTGEFVTWLGYGDADGNLVWKNIQTGVAKP